MAHYWFAYVDDARQTARLCAAPQRASTDRHQLFDRVPGKVTVDAHCHLQLVQCDRTLVVVQERNIRGIASGGDAHQRLPRRHQGPVNHPPLPVDERLGDRMEVPGREAL